MCELHEEEDEVKVKWLLVACMYADGKCKASPARHPHRRQPDRRRRFKWLC